MQARRNRTHVGAWSLALLLVLFAGCTGEATRTLSPRNTGHPILLLVADDESSTAASWQSILIERFGGCDLLPASAVPALLAGGLGERQILVLSQAALGATDSTLAGSLRKNMESGLVVLLDRPTEAWASEAGLRTIGSAALPLRWPESRWTVWGESGSTRQSPPPSAPPTSTLPTTNPVLEYLVQRPQARGVRNVGTPMGLPTVWWKPEGHGGWISLSLPLAELVEELGRSPQLEELQRRRWAQAVVESVLDPNIFPRPFPRVWPRATPAAPSDESPQAAATARARVVWSMSADGNGGYRIQIDGGPAAEASELALPQDWRGQVLADWDTDWTGARSRKVLGARRTWRLIAAPAEEGVLECSYRASQNSSPWR